MKIDLYGDGIGSVDLVDHMGTDLTIVNSARVSFGKHKEKIDEKDEKLINYLVEHRHTSTFEHNLITFRFTVPLFVRSQHHRHRTWSYNEISRRCSMNRSSLGHSTRAIDRQVMPKT
jgi:thymidylate synthase (FAD)